jgi:tRNA pseudouridine38-40 synthase
MRHPSGSALLAFSERRRAENEKRGATDCAHGLKGRGAILIRVNSWPALRWSWFLPYDANLVTTQRYKLTIAYRGTHYHGWQTQGVNPTWKGETPPAGHGIPTIQEKLRRAIEDVVRHEVALVGSSRTDAGVHAKGQVAHFDTGKTQIPIEALRQSVNARLPGDILIRRLEQVADSFDAIRSTISKRYQYVIWNAPDRPPFFNDLVWHRWFKLDLDAMQAAAAHFIGEHDLASFAKPGHGRDNTIRTVHDCSISYRQHRLVIGVEGSGFLWHTVRIIVGTVLDVGLRRRSAESILETIAAKDRTAAGPTAPPQGLYLQWIRSRTTADARADAVE